MSLRLTVWQKCLVWRWFQPSKNVTVLLSFPQHRELRVRESERLAAISWHSHKCTRRSTHRNLPTHGESGWQSKIIPQFSNFSTDMININIYNLKKHWNKVSLLVIILCKWLPFQLLSLKPSLILYRFHTVKTIQMKCSLLFFIIKAEKEQRASERWEEGVPQAREGSSGSPAEPTAPGAATHCSAQIQLTAAFSTENKKPRLPENSAVRLFDLEPLTTNMKLWFWLVRNRVGIHLVCWEEPFYYFDRKSDNCPLETPLQLHSNALATNQNHVRSVDLKLFDFKTTKLKPFLVS